MANGWTETPRTAAARKLFDAALGYADAGEPERALGALHEAITTNPPREMLRVLHRFTATVHRATGDFSAASRAIQSAYDLTLATGDAEKIGPALVATADDAIDNGRFAAAPLLLEQALKTGDPHTRLLAHLAAVRLGLATGDLAGARRALELADAVPEAARSDHPSFYHAYLKMLRVTIDNLTAHTESTLALCRGAKLGYGQTRDRHAILFDAIHAWALAAAGHRDAALHQLPRLEAEADSFTPYTEFRADIYAHLGHTFFSADALDQARLYFEKSLLTCPTPGHAPRILYFLGLAHLRLGHTDAACSHFSRLADLAPDTRFAALARNVLQLQSQGESVREPTPKTALT